MRQAHEHGAAISVYDFLIVISRDTLENWQSEFLQLIWQVAGLAYLLYIGSPQSQESDKRKEAMLEYIVRHLDPKNGAAMVKALEKKFPKR